MQTHLTRGLIALPVTALLLAVGALSSPQPALSDVPVQGTATAEAVAVLPRTVEFHSMLPGALHIVKRVKVGTGS